MKKPYIEKLPSKKKTLLGIGECTLDNTIRLLPDSAESLKYLKEQNADSEISEQELLSKGEIGNIGWALRIVEDLQRIPKLYPKDGEIESIDLVEEKEALERELKLIKGFLDDLQSQSKLLATAIPQRYKEFKVVYLNDLGQHHPEIVLLQQEGREAVIETMDLLIQGRIKKLSKNTTNVGANDSLESSVLAKSRLKYRKLTSLGHAIKIVLEIMSIFEGYISYFDTRLLAEEEVKSI